MQVPGLIDQLAAEGRSLIDAARRAGWDAAVPNTHWTVRELVTHTGGVHRWAEDIVRSRARSGDTEAGRAVGTGPGDDRLVEWFCEGHAALVDTLRTAPADLDCFTFLPADSALHFWARRQAHETAIHRADADAATGSVTAFTPSFAQDGIAEIVTGFGHRKRNAIQERAQVGLRADDGPSWLLTFGGERIEAAETDDLSGADTTVCGSSSDLYLWLWNRPSAATIDGPERIARLWAQTVRVRWS